MFQVGYINVHCKIVQKEILNEVYKHFGQEIIRILIYKHLKNSSDKIVKGNLEYKLFI